MRYADDRDLRDDNLREIAQHVTLHRKRQRPVRKIGDVLSDLFARRGYAQLQFRSELEQAWEAAAGEILARHARPLELRRGVLHIAVENSVAVQELTFQKAHLLSRMKELLATEKIRDLRFKINPMR